MYKHIAGPYKGGLYVDYAAVTPYYPIKERKKMKEEVSPKDELTHDQMMSILVIQDPRRTYIAKEATKIR